MINSAELPSTQDNLPVDERVTDTEIGRPENLAPTENIQAEVEHAETTATSRISELVKSVQGKLRPAAQEALSRIKASFHEKVGQLRRDFEMKQIAKQHVESMGAFSSEQATAQLEQFFGYANPEFSRAETTDLSQDIIQKFFEEHRYEPAEIRGGPKRKSENSRWIFYAQNLGGERFSVEFFRRGDKFAAIDIRKVISEPGKEPEHASESFHLIVDPDGKYKRGYITMGKTQRLVPPGEAEMLMAGYLQSLEFDVESNNAERRRLNK